VPHPLRATKRQHGLLHSLPKGLPWLAQVLRWGVPVSLGPVALAPLQLVLHRLIVEVEVQVQAQWATCPPASKSLEWLACSNLLHGLLHLLQPVLQQT
jgi:hypothetical protein